MARAPRDPDDDSVQSRDGRIDPPKLDIVPKPGRRKRKLRDRPEPPAELKAKEAALEKRARARSMPPGIILEPAGFDEERWTSPHNDEELWWLQLSEAMGTRSRAVFVTFMGQLEKLCGHNIWDDDTHQWRIDEHDLSTMLAILGAAKPRDELEAMHAAQMIATHFLTMRLSARALKYDGDIQTAAAAGKMARTFNDQMRVRQELRGRPRTSRQNIKVSKQTHHHQHIHVHRGEAENGGEPHATDGGTLRAAGARQPEERPALPCSREVNGEVVPFPGGEGLAGVPPPRRTRGRAKG